MSGRRGRPGLSGAGRRTPDGQLAEVKISRGQTIAIAKQFFTIPSASSGSNVSIRQSGDNAVWSLTWMSSERESEQFYIEVSVDAVTGWVTGYRWLSEREAPALTYTMYEARKVAET